MTTETDAVAKLAANAGGAKIIKSTDGREFLVVPEGFEHTEVTLPNTVSVFLPENISQRVTLQTTDSLVEYVNKFGDGTTMLFADMETNSIRAVIDYHGKDAPNHVAHTGHLSLTYSTEWVLWKGISGHLKDQLEFARFIEENGADIAAPPGAEMLEVVRDLQANRKVNFVKAVRTSSDNENFQYSEETTAKTTSGGIEIPTKFLLKIPVYFGEPATEVYAFLRWRLGDGNLTLGIQLHRVEHVRQAVFKAIVTSIAERTKRPAVFGKI